MIGVIALVPEAWTDVWSTRHPVVIRLAQHFPVAWVGPTPDWRAYWRPGGARFLRPASSREMGSNLDVIEPGLLRPRLYRPRWLARRNRAALLAQARRALVARGATHIALYVWRHEYADALDLVEHDSVIYHIDDEYTFSDVESPNPPEEVALARRADRVIVHSPRLLEKKGPLNPRTTLVPNGADFAAYASPVTEAPDLARIPHPRIGYTGVIKRQLDFEVLLHLARARPGWSLVLVGPVGNVRGQEARLAQLQALPNVHFLGSKAVAELPAYVQHFDVCLMCYAVNDYTRYIYPLKLHEYLAGGRPVVSAPVDSVLPHGDVVALAGTPDEWLRCVEAALEPAAQGAEATARRQTRARQHDWNALVARIAALFREVADGTCGPTRASTPKSV